MPTKFFLTFEYYFVSNLFIEKFKDEQARSREDDRKDLATAIESISSRGPFINLEVSILYIRHLFNFKKKFFTFLLFK